MEMTTTKKPATGKHGSKKLTLKKETLKNLDVERKAKGVKGGQRPPQQSTASWSAGISCCWC
jgi:hypothetical protein